MNVHQKPRAGILLEVDLSVRPESYYYYALVGKIKFIYFIFYLYAHLVRVSHIPARPVSAGPQPVVKVALQ